MPDVGPAIDRRTFRQIAQETTEDSVQALICMCCAQVRRTCNSAHADIGRIQSTEYFGKLCGISFAANLDFDQYLRKYGSTRELNDHPQLQSNCWLWKRRVDFGRFKDQDIICCPEDVECDQEHVANLLCPECTFPICFLVLADFIGAGRNSRDDSSCFS